MTKRFLVESIVNDIIWDIRDRSGLGKMWDSMDLEVREGILSDWEKSVKARIDVYLKEYTENLDTFLIILKNSLEK